MFRIYFKGSQPINANPNLTLTLRPFFFNVMLSNSRYSPFDFYKCSEKYSEKSSFQINNIGSRCILMYDIYEL